MTRIDPTRAYALPDLTTDRGKVAVYAIQAMARGEASASQQKQAVDFILNDIALVGDLSWRPDEKGGERETSLAEGRRFVGLQIARIIRNSYERLARK